MTRGKKRGMQEEIDVAVKKKQKLNNNEKETRSKTQSTKKKKANNNSKSDEESEIIENNTNNDDNSHTSNKANNTNEVTEIKQDPATTLVQVKAGDIIALFGEDKKPWFGIVQQSNGDQMRVTYLEQKKGRRVVFLHGETADVPHASLICIVNGKALEGEVVIKDNEQKRAHNMSQKIDQLIANPALENRQRIENWEFGAQYVKQHFEDPDLQRTVLAAMAKDMVILCLHRNLERFGFYNKQHWAKTKDGNGATMFPFLLLLRLMAMSLERGSWQRVNQGGVMWQATITIANVNYRNVNICGGVAGVTWEAALKVLADLGFVAPMDVFNGPQVVITITLPPYKPFNVGTTEVVDLTTAMLEELDA